MRGEIKMAKNEKVEAPVEEKQSKTDVANLIAEKEELIKKLKAEKKDLEEKYTFKGLYTKLAGRKNILVDIRDSDSDDAEKVENAIAVLKGFIQDYE